MRSRMRAVVHTLLVDVSNDLVMVKYHLVTVDVGHGSDDQQCLVVVDVSETLVNDGQQNDYCNFGVWINDAVVYIMACAWTDGVLLL